MPDWFLYIIRCGDNSLYTGITTDVHRRFAEHRGKGGKGAKYLRGKGPLKLVFKKKTCTRSQALKMESKVKSIKKKEKEKLIKTKSNELF
jgi:putative endonuclease